MNETTVCFTGHRQVDRAPLVAKRLYAVLEALIQEGAVDFYAGGAVGFDTLAAQCVLRLRAVYPQIRLHLLLPCGKAAQTARWSARDVWEYDRICAAADSVHCLAERYEYGCMKARNEALVAHAELCVCYYNPQSRAASGTGQTVRLAERKGIRIVNLALA